MNQNNSKIDFEKLLKLFIELYLQYNYIKELKKLKK